MVYRPNACSVVGTIFTLILYKLVFHNLILSRKNRDLHALAGLKFADITKGSY